ncbi:hypothetical protein BDQ12DRAFT_686077 [Crucibulum laeve]|uniref:Membrane-associated proteins in eicosanoid and glutathione metabolism n=1 Tax=Crucibulum laeve TaxID=68775 RepID=A0A5C3M707_9AGAR|nr:hypothetical protein BDQ12DRAFT_686077 [Crucibulum laeve]
MSLAVAIPEGYQYVGAALLSTAWLLLGQGVVVSRFRGRAGVQYPQLYAEKSEADSKKEAYLFNCAQRAHQNTLENIPIIFITTIISGLKFPVLSAAACAYWTLARISYTRGYVTGDPKKRGTTLYRLSYIGLLGLILNSTYVAGGWVLAGISNIKL